MIRGLWTHAGVLYSVDDGFLYSIDSAGLKTQLGALASIGGIVDFDSTLTQLAVNDGTHLYVYTPNLGTFVTVAGYPGGDRLSSLDQRINFQFRGTAQFGWTAAGNATSIDALDFDTVESSPTKLIANLVAHRELWLLKEDVTEIWDPIGGLDVYARSTAAIDYGCVAAHSLQRSSNSVFWLGQDKNGRAMVLQAQGHQAKRISTRSEEEKFEGIELSQARAYTYSDGGQSFYCLNVPTLTTTLVWDETFSEWHERGEWTGTYGQWRPTCHAFAYGKHYFGAGAQLIVLDRNVHNFCGSVNRRIRIAPVISSPTMNRVKTGTFEILCEKGTGATVMLRFSDDNGYTWSNWHYTTVGTAGQYAKRARWRRLGMSYDRVFEVAFTDDLPFNPVTVNVPVQ